MNVESEEFQMPESQDVLHYAGFNFKETLNHLASHFILKECIMMPPFFDVVLTGFD